MGNAVSRVVEIGLDIGLQAACVVTNGFFGQSDEGFHLGPFRLKEKSIGFIFNYRIVRFGITLGKNEFGRIGVDASASVGITGVCSRTMRLGIDSDGPYLGMSTHYKIGPLKGGGSIVASAKGCSFNAGYDGPLMTHFNYSNNTGISTGAFGISVDENGETDFTGVQKFAAQSIGENIKKTYFGNEQKRDKNSSNSGTEKQEENNNIIERDRHPFSFSSTHRRVTKPVVLKKFKKKFKKKSVTKPFVYKQDKTRPGNFRGNNYCVTCGGPCIFK